MERSFIDCIENKKRQYGDKFDDSELNPLFIPYFINQKRIEVFIQGEIKRGRIGITSGWKSCFLLMLTSRSLGSSYVINNKTKIIKEV
jgi:hypothetical protein